MPKPPLQLQGKQFGQLTVRGRHEADGHYWLAVCACGKEVKARGARLVDGTTNSCAECAAQRRGRHGQCRRGSQSPTYISWRDMKQRCGNPRFPSHLNVSYTPEWAVFENFLRDMGPRPPGKTLDRINPFGGYDKENCRWATPETQTNNRRNTVHLVYQPYGLHVIGYVTEWAGFLRNLTGNQKWTNKSLTAIIDSGTMDIDHIVVGVSPEMRAHARLVLRKRLERNEEMAVLRRMFDGLLQQSTT